MTAGQHHRSSLILHFIIINLPHDYSSFPEGVCHVVAMAASSLEKKNLKNPKKNLYCTVYIKMYKKYLFSDCLCLFGFFKFNKSHCSFDLLFFYFFILRKIKIFVLFINAGIEPAFSVKFGNRTRIYIVIKGIEP